MADSMKKVLGLLLLIGFFVASSLLASHYQNVLIGLVDEGTAPAMLLFLLIEILGVIVAPFNTVIFVPFGVAVWGPLMTAFLSLVGWTIGSLIAYQLARRYGRPLVRRFVSLRQVEDAARLLPQSNLFLSIIALRIVVPADLVSYALGLFTPMPWWSYAVATFLGYIPSAIAYAYGATIAPIYQVLLALLLTGFLALGFRHYLLRAAEQSENSRVPTANVRE